MQEGLEENKPTRESKKAFREQKRNTNKAIREDKRDDKQASRFAKVLAKDDARTGFIPASSTNSVKKSGEAILKAVVSDTDATYSDITEVSDLVETANKEEEKVTAQADKVAIGLANQAEEMASNNSVYSQNKALPGDGGTIAKTVASQPIATPSAEQYYTKADFEKEIAKLAAKEKQDAPDIAIDKIGLEDYYPNIGKDIAVGTYSGKYIGSATIFSAAGARLPMGLYDARKKAIKDAAQAQQAAMDKLYELPNSPTQFNEAYQSDYIDWITTALDEAGGYDAFISNPDNRKEMARRMNLGKQMTEIDTRVEALKKSWQPADGKQGVYVPPKLRKKILEWETGKVDNLEDILSGKVNASEFNNYIKSYANGVIWADENMKDWNDVVTEIPINLNTNKPLTVNEKDELVGAINAVKQIKDGSGDYDSYMDVIKKYVSIDTKAMVNSWADLSGYDVDDEARKTLEDYIVSQIKDASFVTNVERQVNKNYEYWAKRYDRANELEDKKSFYTQFYENAINGNIDQKLAGAREQIKAKPGATVEEKTGIMATALQGMGWATEKEYKTINGKTYGYVYHRDILTGGERKAYSLSKEPAKIELYNNNTKKRDYVSVEYANKHRSMYSMSSEEQEVLNAYRDNEEVKVIDSERRSYAAYSDGQGNMFKASSESLGSYTQSGNKTIITETYGAPVKMVKIGEDDDGNPEYGSKKMNVKISYGSDLQDENQRNSLDVHRGRESQGIAGFD